MRISGARSERLPEEQLRNWALEALEQAIAKENAEAEKRDPELGRDNAARRRASRGAPPAPPAAADRSDAGAPRTPRARKLPGDHDGNRRGHIAERLDVVPAQFRVIVTKRPKLRPPCLHGHCRAGPGAGAVDRRRPSDRGDGRPCVLVARYADHLPLYRQAQILARQGVIIERSTLSFWMDMPRPKSPQWCARGCGR